MRDKTQKTARALLDNLVCPITKGPLVYDDKNQQLVSLQIKKAFPIRSSAPILLIEEAVDIADRDLGHNPER